MVEVLWPRRNVKSRMIDLYRALGEGTHPVPTASPVLMVLPVEQKTSCVLRIAPSSDANYVDVTISFDTVDVQEIN